MTSLKGRRGRSFSMASSPQLAFDRLHILKEIRANNMIDGSFSGFPPRLKVAFSLFRFQLPAPERADQDGARQGAATTKGCWRVGCQGGCPQRNCCRTKVNQPFMYIYYLSMRKIWQKSDCKRFHFLFMKGSYLSGQNTLVRIE